ncbi:MAG: AAA family ATPase [Actinomycetota bacterium]|nr:AAA family ATPase [Actinomycetota bacterium]
MAESNGTTCAACGTLNRAGRKFCAECGATLGISCPDCGAANEPRERFCGECGSSLVAPAKSAERSAVAVERRLVSVLFADLVGFTPLSENRDAEDVRELLSRYFELASGVIARYGGEVEKFIGDAVMAVWGTPVAQEDDAERAVRAALDLVEAVGEFGRHASVDHLAARAAILTGEAVVNLGAAGQGMVAGDLVNAASRVQALAEPGSVLVGEATRRATERAIAYSDAGTHEVKGRAEPIALWRALHITAGRRGDLKRDILEPPFVGRERELRLLKELFNAGADQRKAYLVSVIGIAGIGKSRLAWELQKYLDGIDRTIRWHQGRCPSYGDGVSYWALAEMVRMRAGIAEGEEAISARAKLRAAVELHVADPDEREWIEPRLAQLLALEDRDGAPSQDLFAGWRLFLERVAESGPVVLVFEDMQWADVALLEFLEYLLDWSRNHPIFVLALARPELAERHANWAAGLRSATTLALEPLADEAMEALLDGFAPGLPEDIRRQVLHRAEGVPLYAVEIVRMLLDRGLVEQKGNGYRPAGEIDILEVPETLQGLIAARLDGLNADERRLLQDASILGKSFTSAALASVTHLPQQALESLLTALARKEILSLQADPRSPERGQFSFLQDLLRQVAYDTLPRSERKARHIAAATYLEQESLAGEQDLAEIVASHYRTALEFDPDASDAGVLRAKARTTLVKAGERAESVAANENARRYFEQALELAESRLERAELHERAGRMATLALRRDEARAHLEQAIADFEEVGLTHPAARVRAQLGVHTWQHEGDIERAIADLEQAFGVLVGEERDADLGMLAVTLGRPLFFAGRLDDAMARTELALEVAESLLLPEVLSHGLNTKALILATRGRHEEAELLMRHALEVALEGQLSGPALRAYLNLAAIVSDRDRIREGLELALRGLELGRKIGDRGVDESLRGWVRGNMLLLGQWDEVFAEERELDIEDERILAWHRSLLVGPLVWRGHLEEAERRLEAIRPRVDMRELQQVAYFRITEAELLLGSGRASEALVVAEGVVEMRAEVAGGMSQGAVKQALAVALESALTIGDEEKVDELLGLVERIPPGQMTPSVRALGARFAARRAVLRRDSETASAGFLAAARIFREIETPFELALVLLEHAEWLAGDGQMDEVEGLAAEAREIFERLRASPYLERLASLPQPLPVAAS